MHKAENKVRAFHSSYAKSGSHHPAFVGILEDIAHALGAEPGISSGNVEVKQAGVDFERSALNLNSIEG